MPIAPPQTLRYLDFLVQEWPKLQSKNLARRDGDPVKRSEVLSNTLKQIEDQDGLRLEFGVWKGVSIKRCAALYPDRQWYGFDSFEGFPDDGRADWQKPFKVIHLPATPSNVTLIKGFFSDSLGPFLDSTEGNIAFINIDCDLYSSTSDVFSALEKHQKLRPGVIIYFDELINYDGYMWNESKALYEMLERTGLGVEWLHCDQHLRQPNESAKFFADDGSHPTWMQDVRAGFWQQASLRLTSQACVPGPMHDPEYLVQLSNIHDAMLIQERHRAEALAKRNAELSVRAAQLSARVDERRISQEQHRAAALVARDKELAQRAIQRKQLQEKRLVERRQADALRRQQLRESRKTEAE